MIINRINNTNIFVENNRINNINNGSFGQFHNADNDFKNEIDNIL